jgi:hypothetical protein
MTSISTLYSDIETSNSAFTTFSNYLKDSPDRSIGLAADGFRLCGNYQLANSCDTASSVLSGVSLISNITEFPTSLKKCVDTVRQKGFFKTEILNPIRILIKTISKIFVDMIAVLGAPGVTFNFPRQVSKIAPFVDIFVQSNDVLENIQELREEVTSDDIVVVNASALKKKQYLCEVSKSSLLLISSIAILSGLMFPAFVLFSISITAFALGAIAFFIKQDRIELREKHLININIKPTTT